MSVEVCLCYSATAVFAFLAGIVLLPRAASPARWFCVVGLVAFAAETLFIGLSFEATSGEAILRWQRLKLIPQAILPGAWLLFSLCYARGNYRNFLASWRVPATLIAVGPLVLVLGWSHRIIESVRLAGRGEWAVLLGGGGKVFNLLVLLGAVLVLMNLERTFRTALGVMRWRIKYMVLALTLVFGVIIYCHSQVLLYSGIEAYWQLIYVCALLVAAPLIVLALLRTRLGDLDVYPSQALLHHSLTAVLAGVYLLITGVLAKIVAGYGGDAWLPLKSLAILIALVGLGILLFSDRLRQRTAFWVSRHFQRPLYDYRKAWSLITERTTSLADETSLSRAVVTLLAETFNLLSVSMWLVDPQQRQLVLMASTALSPEKTPALNLQDPALAPLLSAFASSSAPVDLEAVKEPWVEILQQHDPDLFKKGGNRLGLPLVSHGEFVGLITLADRVSGFRFIVEDFDLFKCIGDQVAASLRNLRLTGRLLQAKQVEAFQNMATFFVHDLKNTAATLSLITQNMAAHFNDPAFREDALSGLTRSVTHFNELIKRLTSLRLNVVCRKIEADLNELIKQATASLEGTPGITVVRELQSLPKILLDPDQITKLVTNLALNAREACGARGEIKFTTRRRDPWIELTVADTGCGMSQDFIKHRLFQPFQTTKKQGLGIGMLHCKMIVDAHQGRIEVESEEGRGSCFRVLLPHSPQTP